MPPQLIPADPRFTTESERAVWSLLRESLRPQDTLMANVRLTDDRKDHEADLIVVMPGVAVVVVTSGSLPTCPTAHGGCCTTRTTSTSWPRGWSTSQWGSRPIGDRQPSRTVEALLDEGWLPEHMALLTTGRRHPEQVARQDLEGQDGYWDTYWDDELVFYGHVLGFKGLERRAVVLCVNEDGTWERFRERIYVGLSRATDRLIVVGDLNAIGHAGDEVVKELRGRH